MANPILTQQMVIQEAKTFAGLQANIAVPKLYGTTDGKAVGNYIEKAFKEHLAAKYLFAVGNAAKGIDLPGLGIDVKGTSIDQPQSSSPFKTARQKIFGLGYSLLVFVYDKTDDPTTQSARLIIRHTIFVDAACTADFQMTTGLKKILENDGNVDDLTAFMRDKNLPVDDIEANSIAEDLLVAGTVAIGYLTISNALQWRLQYKRVINMAGTVLGITRVQ